jgi:putative acetyltransferase
MLIRPEKSEDISQISEITRAAFNQEDEVRLIETLRSSSNFIHDLSLVAVQDNKIVGHILFNKILVRSEELEIPILALAPLSVHPDYQNRGFGAKLVSQGLKKCKELGYGIVNVLGHENYYPRFRFRLASDYGIYPPVEEWKNNFFIIELIPDTLKNVKGMVVYPAEFDITI